MMRHFQVVAPSIRQRAARAVTGVVVIGVLLAPARASAQACFGLPSDGAASYQYTRYGYGKGHGGDISVTPGRFALSANANTHTAKSRLTKTSGFEAGGRAALILSMGRVQLCPGIVLGYSKLTHDRAEFDLSNQQAFLRGGAGLGIEQHVYKGVYVIPSVGVHYDFTAIKYDVIADGGENSTTGDSLSRVAIDYTVGLRYRFAYVAATALRYTETSGGHPNKARFIVGFAFGNPRRDD